MPYSQQNYTPKYLLCPLFSVPSSFISRFLYSFSGCAQDVFIKSIIYATMDIVIVTSTVYFFLLLFECSPVGFTGTGPILFWTESSTGVMCAVTMNVFRVEEFKVRVMKVFCKVNFAAADFTGTCRALGHSARQKRVPARRCGRFHP